MNNDLLYQDCVLSLTADLNAPKEVPPACDSQPNNDERNRIAQFYPGKLVVYFSVGVKPRYDETARKWKMDAWRGVNWSNHVDSFVLMNPGDPGQILAHEVGHYLHLVHSMGPLPRCLDDQITADGKPAIGTNNQSICLTTPVPGGRPVLDAEGRPEVAARTLVRDYVTRNGLAKADGVNVFDGDKDICRSNPTILCVRDTAPDPGSALFIAAGLNPCNVAQGSLSFAVSYPDGPFTYTFMPGRDNVMNYWDKSPNCLGVQAAVSRDQVAGVRAAVTTMNRNHLIQKKVLYTAVWEPGDRATSRAIGWNFADFPTRFNQEIAAGRHLVHMQAYDIGGGQIRYDAVWEDGARGTDWVIGWAFNDFVRHLEEETAAGRTLVHLQSYAMGDGQLRFDGVWEANPSGQRQTHILAETIYPFAVRFNQETQQGGHLRFMHAVVGR